MSEPVIVIAGGSSGVGAAAARVFREQGANVAITGRSPETTRLALEIGADPFIADFARLADVRNLADALLHRYGRIDILVNNAGAVVAGRQITGDGHEKTFQVNHLAPFLLTLLLRERLESSSARVINTASRAHMMGRLDLDDLEGGGGNYRSWTAYGATKLMNILHAAEIPRRFRGVTAASFHPGVVATGFGREGGRLTRFWYGTPVVKAFMVTPEAGADTLVWLATTPPGTGWQSGGYYQRRKPAKRSGQAQDDSLASKLWDLSEAMVS